MASINANFLQIYPLIWSTPPCWSNETRSYPVFAPCQDESANDVVQRFRSSLRSFDLDLQFLHINSASYTVFPTFLPALVNYTVHVTSLRHYCAFPSAFCSSEVSPVYILICSCQCGISTRRWSWYYCAVKFNFESIVHNFFFYIASLRERYPHILSFFSCPIAVFFYRLCIFF